MTEKPENQPAFPVPDAASWQCHGMTLRDWFAGQFLAGYGAQDVRWAPDSPAKVAGLAYRLADAMLAARGDK